MNRPCPLLLPWSPLSRRGARSSSPSLLQHFPSLLFSRTRPRPGRQGGRVSVVQLGDARRTPAAPGPYYSLAHRILRPGCGPALRALPGAVCLPASLDGGLLIPAPDAAAAAAAGGEEEREYTCGSHARPRPRARPRRRRCRIGFFFYCNPGFLVAA